MSSLGAFLFAAAAVAGDCPPKDAGSVDDAIALITGRQLAKAGGPASSCPPVTPAPIHFASPTAWKAEACTPKFDIDSVCAYASSYCNQPDRSAGVSGGCWYGLGKAPACVSDSALLDSHEPIVRYAAARFYGIVSENARSCCGTNEECLKGFSATRLVLNRGLGADDLTGFFDNSRTDENIHVSVGALVNCSARDCVERLFQHELGHACDFWRANRRNPVTGRPYAPVNALPRPEEASRRAMAAAVGPSAADCVMAALEKERDLKEMMGSSVPSYDQWVEEALADANFIGNWKSAGTWGWNCNSATDGEHANPRLFSGCFLALPAVRKNICGI